MRYIPENLRVNMSLLSGVVIIGLLFSLAACHSESDQPESQNVDGKLLTSMEEFHSLLWPLWHKSAPRNDYETILRNASGLDSLATVIEQHEIPTDLAARDSAYHKHLRKLRRSTKQLKAMDLNASGDSVTSVFRDIHDSYESLADIVYSIQI